MTLEDFEYSMLEEFTDILPFNCGDDDLNEFLIEKAKPYKSSLLATTYLITYQSKTVAYLSIYNDSLKVQEENFASKNAFKRWIKANYGSEKRHLRTIPAIKIGRLAVCIETKLHLRGIGTKLVNMVKELATEYNSRCACQLITVDAYSKSTDFYKKQGFEFLSKKDYGEDTRQMFYDLRPLINTIQKAPN